MDFRFLAIDGPPGVGKTALAERIATRVDAALVLDDTENPFLEDAHADRPGAAFQAQLFSLLARHRQQSSLRQADLFTQVTVSDFLFDKDKIYAYLNLDDNELFIYQRLHELLVRDIPQPDLAIFLQAPHDVVWRRLKHRSHRDDEPAPPLPGAGYVREVVDAFNHFFFHYAATPLLVVETSDLDLSWPDDVVDELLRQVHGMAGGTRYYVPRS